MDIGIQNTVNPPKLAFRGVYYMIRGKNCELF